MTTVFWPMDLLIPQKVRFDIAPRSLSGPAAISGFSQVVSSDAGIWLATFSDIPVKTRAEVNTWRAISALLEGRTGSLIVPLSTPWLYQPSYTGEWETSVPHSDDSYFSDGTGYLSSDNVIYFTSAAALRATSATVTIDQAPNDMQPGQHFSINDSLYRLKTVVYSSATSATITFTPPLRAAAAALTELEFDRPTCTMRLATDNEMDLPLDIGRWGNPSINLIEDV